MNGFFKIHRALFNKPIWRDSTIEQQIILITLLGLANWQPSEYVFEGEITRLRPGEFVASVEDIRLQIDKPEITTKKIRLAFERFKKLGFLSVRRVSRKAIAKSRIIQGFAVRFLFALLFAVLFAQSLALKFLDLI